MRPLAITSCFAAAARLARERGLAPRTECHLVVRSVAGRSACDGCGALDQQVANGVRQDDGFELIGLLRKPDAFMRRTGETGALWNEEHVLSRRTEPTDNCAGTNNAIVVGIWFDLEHRHGVRGALSVSCATSRDQQALVTGLGSTRLPVPATARRGGLSTRVCSEQPGTDINGCVHKP